MCHEGWSRESLGSCVKVFWGRILYYMRVTAAIIGSFVLGEKGVVSCGKLAEDDDLGRCS